MPEMTSKEAIERIETYIAATDADTTPWIKALRLAVGALEEKAEQEGDDPRRAPTGRKGMTQ